MERDPMRPDGTMAVAMHVPDWRGPAEWYRSVFGFTTTYENGELGFCELNTSVPGVTLILQEANDDALLGTVIPTFGVVDADEEHTRLQQVGGVDISAPEHFPGIVKILTVQDPYGNRLLLCQNLEGEQ